MQANSIIHKSNNHAAFEIKVDKSLTKVLHQSMAEVMELLRVSGAGVALFQNGMLKMVVASDDTIITLDPNLFYTQQTVSNDRITEIMMPFGCHYDGFADELASQIHYYHGIPLRSQAGHCIGCLFVVNNKHCSLSAMERKVFSLLHKSVQLEVALHVEVSQSIDISAYSQNHFSLHDISTLLDTMEDFIFIKNTQFEIIFANPSFLQLYPEQMRDKVVGYTTFEEYLPAEADVFTQDDRDAFAKGYKETVETIAFPNGTIRTLMTTKTRITLAGESVIFCVAKDITDEHLLQKQLENAQQDIEFLSKTSMLQLSAPIDRIQRLAGYIFEDFSEVVDDLALQQLREIQENTTVISSFLQTLTEFSRFQRRAELTQKFSLTELVIDLQKLTNFPDDGVLLCTEASPKLPLISCQMVLLALINNTLQHGQTDHPKITITVEFERQGTTFHYRDNGVGFSKDSLNYFKLLWSEQTSLHGYLAYQSGLYSCKRILDLYDGKMQILPYRNSQKLTIFWPNR